MTIDGCYVSISVLNDTLWLLFALISAPTHLSHRWKIVNSHLHNFAKTVWIESVLIIIWLRVLVEVKVIGWIRALMASLPEMLSMRLQRSIIGTISNISFPLTILEIDLVHTSGTQVPSDLWVIEAFINTWLEVIIWIINIIDLLSGHMSLLLLELIAFKWLSSYVWPPVLIIISDHLLFIVFILNWRSLSLGRGNLALILSLRAGLARLQVTQWILLLCLIYWL